MKSLTHICFSLYTCLHRILRCVPPTHQQSSYSWKFQEALRRSGYCCLAHPSINKAIPDVEIRVDRIIQDLLPKYRYSDIFSPRKCLQSSICLSYYLTSTTGIRSWPTLGQFWYESKPTFFISEPDAARLARSEITLSTLADDSSEADFHAWITLENGFILDATIVPTISEDDPDEDRRGDYKLGPPETIIKSHSYVPLLVGEKLLGKLLRESTTYRAYEIK